MNSRAGDANVVRGASHSPQIAESPRKTPRSLEKAIPYIAIEDSQALGGVEPFFFCGRFEDEVARWPNRRSLHRHHFYEVFFMQQGRGICCKHYKGCVYIQQFFNKCLLYIWYTPCTVGRGVAARPPAPRRAPVFLGLARFLLVLLVLPQFGAIHP